MTRYGRDYQREFGGRDRGYLDRDRAAGPRRPFRDDGWFGGDFIDRYDADFHRQGGYPPDRHGDRSGGRYRGEDDRGLFGDGGDSARRRGAYRDRDPGYREGGRDHESTRGREGRGPGLFNQPRDRLRAAEIMTEDPHTVTPEARLTEVAQRMRDLDVGIIPVVDDDGSRRLRGVITDRDIAIRAVAEGKNGDTTVEECMTDRVRYVNKNDSIQDVMRVMSQEQVRRVPVTDREGRLVGIIAQADLAVDYAADDDERGSEVGEVLERVSEPARPNRVAGRMVASGDRDGRSGEES